MKNEKLDVSEALYKIYLDQEITYPAFINRIENDGNRRCSLFFKYVSHRLNIFESVIKQIDKLELTNVLKEFYGFQGKISKVRFVHLIKIISNEFIKVLKECYNPNQVDAMRDLEKILGNDNKKLTPYLIEQLINYCTFDYPQNCSFYRVRDEITGKNVDNCWHTPYFMRQNCYAGRFSRPGFPCLYLADSPETCYKEVGVLARGKSRWLGEFQLKGKQVLICLDLRIPTEEEIKTATPSKRIQFFLTYPLRLLCTTFAEHKSDSFGEEYMFSQVLVNVLSHPSDENSGMCRVKGILYNSTRNPGGINIALPAESVNIPPDQDEKYSESLQKLFLHKQPYKVYSYGERGD